MSEYTVPVREKYSWELTERTMDALCRKYDFIQKTTEGKSILEKDLSVLQIGNGKKQLFVSASHHANEWITTPIAQQVISANAEKIAAGDQEALRWFSQVTLYVMPLVNPDGVDLVNGFIRGETLEQAKAIAADYPDIPYPDGWKANIRGTDLNLNYPAGWVQARRLKYAAGFDSPAPRDFVGFAPLSEPESRSVYEYTLRQSFAMVIALHTQGEVIYWQFEGRAPERAEQIGLLMAQASGYRLDEPEEFSSYAGYKDWFIKNFDRPGYTVECGKGQNPLPIEEFDSIYPPVERLLFSGLDSVDKIL